LFAWLLSLKGRGTPARAGQARAVAAIRHGLRGPRRQLEITRGLRSGGCPFYFELAPRRLCEPMAGRPRRPKRAPERRAFADQNHPYARNPHAEDELSTSTIRAAQGFVWISAKPNALLRVSDHMFTSARFFS
jgi:hypothetical protein